MEIDRITNEVLIHVSRPAMAGEFEICFPAALYPAGTDYALEALDVVDAVEEQLSFFRPNSAINQINRCAAEEPVQVEPALFDLLSQAIKLSQETEGAYDITATPLWEVWGFARRTGRMPAKTEWNEARQFVGSHWVELDPEHHTIRFRKPGIRISLGSVGKGYAIDRCSEKLQAFGMCDYLLSGDLSSILAHGTNWKIGIRNPNHPDQRLGVLHLLDRALGTSGVEFQSFHHEGHRYSHLLDPRTGMPVENVLSTTVVASSAALADMLSTALFVLGPQKSLEYCSKHPEIGLIMIATPPDGQGQPILTAGLDQDILTLSPHESSLP